MDHNGTRRQAHCVILPFPLVGHINPMLQFAKRLDHRGIHVSFFLTPYAAKATALSSPPQALSIHTFSDGFDDGYPPGLTPDEYLARFLEVAPVSLKVALEKLVADSGRPIDCIVYDAGMAQAGEIADKLGVMAAMFFTQSCVVNWIFHEVSVGKLKLPIADGEGEVLVPGLPGLEPRDLPSFISGYGSYPGLMRMLLEQFRGIEKAKWLLINTFHKLEEEVLDYMAKSLPMKPIGPAIPSKYLDNRLPDDAEYGLSLFTPTTSTCLDWLNQRPPNSVVYVAFGSMAEVGHDQMVELAWGLEMSNHHFLWVVRSSERTKLPNDFFDQTSRKGLIVAWGPQLDILAHAATSCFITHCGWNSTLETLSMGVPVVAMPQWTDQTTNAKWMSDVWKTGVRVSTNVEGGLVKREVIAKCVRDVMEGERADQIRRNAQEWKELARAAMEEGGSSDKNIEEFVQALTSVD